jgi:hypothetical protein
MIDVLTPYFNLIKKNKTTSVAVDYTIQNNLITLFLGNIVFDLVHDKNRYTYNYQQIILSRRDKILVENNCPPTKTCR